MVYVRIRPVKHVRENALKVVTGTAHEGVAEAAKICAVAHFFSEDVGDVEFSADMRDGDGAVGDPFAYRIFSVLDVTILFGGHIVTPFDASVIVVVESCGRIAVRYGVTVGEPPLGGRLFKHTLVRNIPSPISFNR